ncbi:hypothetical protein [Aquipseudomonas alcaligenes]|uniref:Uncharacterized protein n=1 Tax=Aquipseudomonas alcaligenes TaxID=43263 RepID=A0AA42N633_AQUAC|nr:hypothetical protein [Pseudomonas alcaligenes]MDH1057430.1 hypothetical protein [Pseudomonas alcaligenes]
MRNNRTILGKCRIIFFDLEFYVPENSRSKTGFCYNPWDKSCKILGGSFLLANPEKDFGIIESDVYKRTKSLWLWEHGSEKELLQQIYNTLKGAHEIVRNAHDGAISPILCGIGITSSDIPILFELFKRFGILSNPEAFAFQNSFRAIDLSQLSIATFNNPNNFLYPKTKSHILNKYIPGTKFESGKSVWELYESKEFKEIQARVLSEVYSTHRCYELIKSDLDKFKSLELSNKKREKIASKTQAENSAVEF